MAITDRTWKIAEKSLDQDHDSIGVNKGAKELRKK